MLSMLLGHVLDAIYVFSGKAKMRISSYANRIHSPFGHILMRKIILYTKYVPIANILKVRIVFTPVFYIEIDRDCGMSNFLLWINVIIIPLEHSGVAFQCSKHLHIQRLNNISTPQRDEN